MIFSLYQPLCIFIIFRASLSMNNCRYCDQVYQKSARTVIENESWFANYDMHPVSSGHMKIIPRRHVNSIAELTHEELASMKEMFIEAELLVNELYHPDGYNLGLNHGEAAGQTVFHLHIHFIPRYNGDMKNPAGGIRNMIPRKANS